MGFLFKLCSRTKRRRLYKMAFLLNFLVILAIFIYVFGYPIPRTNPERTYQYLPFLSDIKGLVTEIPVVRIGPNPYLNYLATVLLFLKVMEVLFSIGKVVWYCFPCCRKGRNSKGFAGTWGRALRKPVSGWQGIWSNFGKFLGRVTAPISWDFTPEQVFDPDEMARCLAEGCFSYEDPNTQFFALYWGLASAYRAAVDYARKAKAEAETQALSPETSVASTKCTKRRTQTTSPEIPLAPVVTKKSWISAPDSLSLRPDGDQSKSEDDGAATDTDTSVKDQPPQEVSRPKAETTVSRSMTPAELRDLKKDYSRRPGERILAWLLRCRDRGARSHLLSIAEAQQLASISGNRELDHLIAEAKSDLSLWARLVLGVKQKFPFKDYLQCPMRKWTKVEDAILYLRELALLEIMYDNEQYDPVADDPEGVTCTMPMWKKIIQGAPASYVHILAAIMLPNTENTLVGTLCTVLPHLDEAVGASNEFSRDYSDSSYRRTPEKEEPYERSEYDDDYGDHRDRRHRDRSAERSRPRSRSWSRSRSRSPSVTRRRSENSKRKSKRSELWSYLRTHGENMRRWDGEPTSRLEARVRELKHKEADKKVVYVVDADFFEKELRSPRFRKTGVRFQDDRKASGKPKQRSDGECSNQNQ